jgi:aminomethyltransferase
MSSTPIPLKKTILYDQHKTLNAKLVPFAGWEMPVQYEGVIPEHNATRSCAGIFDVSHMGEIRIKGNDAVAAINYLFCNDASVLIDGQAQYGAVLNERGGVVDDIIVYRISDSDLLVCVNASNADTVFDWFKAKNTFDVEITNESNLWSQIALQGPKAKEIAEKFFSIDLSELKFFRFKSITFKKQEVIIARTGYTGEDGFEFFIPNSSVESIWKGLLEVGQPIGLKPCGLGARDSLRLEAALPLHGHELDQNTSAIESGLKKFIALGKKDFIGKKAILELLSNDSPERRELSGFVLTQPGIARQGDTVFQQLTDIQAGPQIGVVTSGTKTPTVNKAICMALVKGRPREGERVFFEIRGKKVAGELVPLPFYKRKK